MEDKISINKVFALYLSVESHYRSYQAAKYTLDKILKYEPKSHTVFMDAYDVCNLIYPKSIMIGDNHYDIAIISETGQPVLMLALVSGEMHYWIYAGVPIKVDAAKWKERLNAVYTGQFERGAS